MQIEGKYADRVIKRDVFNMKKEKTQNISCWNLRCFNVSQCIFEYHDKQYFFLIMQKLDKHETNWQYSTEF